MRNNRFGSIYLIWSETGHYKIGRSANPRQRFSSLRSSSPLPLRLIHFFETSDCISVERDLHERFKSSRIAGGEWFTLTDAQVEWFKGIHSWLSSFGPIFIDPDDFDLIEQSDIIEFYHDMTEPLWGAL